MTTNGTIPNTYITPEVDKQAVKLALRIRNLAKKARGRVIYFEVQSVGDGAYWLYVNGGERETIEP